MPGDGPSDDATRVDPLGSDRLLRACKRVPWEGGQAPVLGRVVLTAAIGRGGMGAVYRGVHRSLGHERAVKVLLASAEDAARERFLREARIAAQIDSPHLVRVHDADEDPVSGLVYLEMEFVRGTSAAQWARDVRGGVPEDAALTVCLAATRGLEAAHAAGVVHRDIKPGNILLPAGAGGAPALAAAKVADLGLARREEGDASLTATHMFVGTPGFAPPEQIADAKRAGKPADVFSMGATLYALLSGRSPFEGTSTSDTIVRTTLGKRPPLADLRAGLSPLTIAIVDRCLAMEPSDRYADATALREALEQRLFGGDGPPTVGAGYVRRGSEESTVAAPAAATPAPRAAPPAPKLAPPLTAVDPAAVPAAPRTTAPAAPSPTPAPATPAVSPAPAPRRSGVGVLVLGSITLAVVGVVLVARSGLFPAGDFETPPSAPWTQDPPEPPDEPEAPPDAGTDDATVHLLFCPPLTRVFVGDREVKEGDTIPAVAGTARITWEGFEDQVVAFAPNEDGEVWVKPGEWRRPAGWTWTGDVAPVLAPGAKLEFEMLTTFEGEMADAVDAAFGGEQTPTGVEWEVVGVPSPRGSSIVRLKVTRIRGRVLDSDDGPYAFDSAGPGWEEFAAEHEDEIASVAPLGLLRAGPIRVTFGADGRARSWDPFPADDSGLIGTSEGGDEDVQRSVIGLLVLRPDRAGATPLGAWTHDRSDPATAHLLARNSDGGVNVASSLELSLRDGFGLSQSVVATLPGMTIRVQSRRR